MISHKKRYQQQHEQENVSRQGPIIHHHASMQSQSLPHSTRHSEPRRYPRSPQIVQVNLGTATQSPPSPSSTPSTPKKRSAHAETNLHQPKARQIVGEHQNYQSLDQWKPIPAHTNIPRHKQYSHSLVTPIPPRVSPHLPCTSTHPAHRQEDQVLRMRRSHPFNTYSIKQPDLYYCDTIK